MERTDSTEKTGIKGNWLVILGGFGRYIACTKMTREEVREARKTGAALVAQDAFEFTSQVQMGQAPHPTDPHQAIPTIGKMNIAYRVDAACYPFEMEFPIVGSLIYWLDGLNQSDALTYKNLIQQAVHMGEGWAKQRAAASSGLTMATDMPTGTPVPGVPGAFRA